MSLTLFHNGMSTCSQKVRLALAEKQLDFESRVMDLQGGDQFAPAYLKLNPSALVPTLLADDRSFVESTLIIEYLDDRWPEPRLTPAAADARYQMRLMLRRIDEVLHPACSVITYAIALRPLMLRKEPDELQALIEQIRDPVRREGRRAVLADGVHAPVFQQALHQYLQVLELADQMLGDSPWLAGADYSLADCSLTPYVLRLEHLGQAALVERLPQLSRWYAEAQQRSSWQTAIAAWLPERAVATFFASGLEVQQAVADMAQ